MNRVLKSPFLLALLAGVVVLLVAFAPALWQVLRGTAPAPVSSPEAPWSIAARGDGVAAFGLQLPGSTLADADQRWGEGLQLAVMAETGQPGALEGYVERFDGGGVGGRLLLTTSLGDAELLRLQQTAAEREPAGGTLWRYPLRASERPALGATPLVGLSFIPATNLDAQTLRQRFGEPDEVIAPGGRLEHWLYPARGLAIAVDAEGRELLQVVAPADFERRLRAPLKTAASAAASPAASALR
ncbi:hypothetical protein [Rubrivivax gelatinosus]|uniref:Uncharacterized protein n=1 Tax=Rubrivivax gelatinosus TaxID=28068 RepID=A0A4R2MC95_RUBGE|nr:hypothetical protein [Rubrivivax gelatinosus]MBK1687004.1 hypothetical protein [Rubrivivax gelatinosus]TCP02187.1 hypothetical protein EV684_107193 [Rubrivivax gelatinosus]